MKRKERHHLKENELVHSIETRARVPRNPPASIAGAVVGVVVVVLAVDRVHGLSQQTQSRGSELLAEAMVAMNARVVPTGTTGEENLPAGATLGATGTFSTEEAKLKAALPKLKAAADAYPDSASGITARYHMAGALAALGRNQEAIKEFDEVDAASGATSLYGRMARLGKADTQAHSGQLDAAIATWKEMTTAQYRRPARGRHPD